jgi:hypothetical protein
LTPRHGAKARSEEGGARPGEKENGKFARNYEEIPRGLPALAAGRQFFQRAKRIPWGETRETSVYALVFRKFQEGGKKCQCKKTD